MIIDGASISEADALAAGFPDLQALTEASCGSDDGRNVYRIRIGGIGPDPRPGSCSASPMLTERDLSEIALRLERWDQAKASPGWHRRVLRLIADNPATLAARLAAKASLREGRLQA